MGDLPGIAIFSFCALAVLGFTAWTVRMSRRHGHPVKMLDHALQFGYVLFLLPLLVDLRPAAKIPICVVAGALSLIGMCHQLIRLIKMAKTVALTGRPTGDKQS